MLNASKSVPLLRDPRKALKMYSNVAHPMKLTMSSDAARRLIDGIPHETCRRAAENNWNPLDGGHIAEESVNWLFCWGKTGMGSATAAEAARRVFDRILPITFAEYNSQVDHEYARAHRYPEPKRT